MTSRFNVNSLKMSKTLSFENIFVDNEINDISPQFKIIQIGSTDLENDVMNMFTSQPLEGVATESVPNIYQLNQVVFAEPIYLPQSPKYNKGNEDNIDGSSSAGQFEDTPLVENIVEKKKRGRKRKYVSSEADIGPHKCPEPSCTREFPTLKRAVEHHHKIHVLERDRFHCNACSRAFPERYLLVRHMAVHDRSKQECPICQKMISVRSSLVLHMRSHSGEKLFTCLLCGQSFTRQSGLTTHQQFVHRKDGLKCVQCSTSFNRRIELSRHMQSVHSSQPTVECDLCGCRFTTLAALGAHRTKRHDVYLDAGSKVLHKGIENNILLNPTKEKNTNKTENRAEVSVVEHRAPSIGRIPEHTIITEIKNTTETCLLCKSEYLTRWNLIQHIRTHINNDDTTFLCQICNKNIDGGEKAQTHFDKIHSGTPMLHKEHCCTVCYRTFKRKDQLTRHITIHIGEKNWQCEFCPRGFLRRAQLTKHHTRLHKQESNIYNPKTKTRPILS